MRIGTAGSATLLLLGLLAGGAHAAWDAGATADVAVTAATLPTPDAVDALCSGNDDVLVTWSSTDGAPVVASFVVQRLSDARGATWLDVATVAAGSTAAHSHEDLDLPVGGYTYRVLAVNGAWSGAVSAVSPTRTIAEIKGRKPRALTCS